MQEYNFIAIMNIISERESTRFRQIKQTVINKINNDKIKCYFN